MESQDKKNQLVPNFQTPKKKYAKPQLKTEKVHFETTMNCLKQSPGGGASPCASPRKS